MTYSSKDSSTRAEQPWKACVFKVYSIISKCIVRGLGHLWRHTSLTSLCFMKSVSCRDKEHRSGTHVLEPHSLGSNPISITQWLLELEQVA